MESWSGRPVSLETNGFTPVVIEYAGNEHVTLDVRATSGAAWQASTNFVWSPADPPTYMVLRLAARAQAPAPSGSGICGFVYTHEREPLDDVRVMLDTSNDTAEARTDPLGYFEAHKAAASVGDMLGLTIMFADQFHMTNLLYTGAPLEWVLLKPDYITGRVCIGSSATPATSFWLSVASQPARRIDAADGRFTVPVPLLMRQRNVLVSARMDGAAPAEKSVDTRPAGDIDAGDLIITGAPATLRGRVVDHRGQPLHAVLALGSDTALLQRWNIVETKEGDGTFAFSDLPAGMYCVSVTSPGTYDAQPLVTSGLVALQPGEECTLPDIMVVTTNTPRVRLTFVLPDGAPAVLARVPFRPNTTDADGCVETRLACGTYANLAVLMGTAAYFTEEFVVTPATQALTVQLRAPEFLRGRVTLQGQALEEGTLYFTPERGEQRPAKVASGQFELKAPAGRYCVMGQGGFAVVTLRADTENVIALARDTAAMRVITPPDESWSVRAFLRFGENQALIYGMPRTDGQSGHAGLPPGEYVLRGARIEGYSIITNAEQCVRISAGEDVTVSFGK